MRVTGNEVEELYKAQSNIEHMKMRHKSGTLSELRSMTNPPTMVKTTLESVCLLLGEKVDSWRSIKSVISKNTFLLNIIQLKTEDISDQTIRMMNKKYLSNPLYTVDHVARVSTACAPLVKWCLAHVTYAEIVRGKENAGKMEEGNKRDSLGTDEESLGTLEDSFELEEAAIEREEIEQVEEVNVPVENNERIEEIVEMAVKEEEAGEEIVEKEELNEPADETVEKEELIEPPKETVEKKELIESTEETVEEKVLIESTEERVEETKEMLGEGVKEEAVSIEEISNDDLQESSSTLLVEEEKTPVIETKEELIIKKVDTLCKEEDPIGNEEESLGREV